MLFAISTTSALADIRITQGRLHGAISVYQRGLQIATAQSKSILQGTADIYLGLAELYHEQGKTELARQTPECVKNLYGKGCMNNLSGKKDEASSAIG